MTMMKREIGLLLLCGHILAVFAATDGDPRDSSADFSGDSSADYSGSSDGLNSDIEEGQVGNDLAVIIGGVNNEGNMVAQLEIYTGHLGDGYSVCGGTLGELNSLPKPPRDTKFSAAIFVPDSGIYMCGGLNRQNLSEECFYIQQASSAFWTPFPLPKAVLGGIVKTSMLLLAGQEDEGFLLMGGYHYPDGLEQPLKRSYIYNFREKAWSMSQMMLEKGTTNVALMWVNHISGVDHLVYVIRAFTSTITCFCNQTISDLNCADINWICTDHPDDFMIKPDGAATIGIRSSQDDEDKEMDAVVLVSKKGGDAGDAYLLTIRDWNFNTNSPIPTLKPIAGPRRENGNLVSLNGDAYYFGGSDYGQRKRPNLNLGVSDTVLQYDSYQNTWIQLESNMASPRAAGTVVSVPESWFCEYHFTTTEQPSTSCPNTGNCTRTDSRGVLWTGFFGETSYKDCPEGSDNNGRGRAYWYCDSCRGDFFPEEPDRSGCVANWLGDIQDMIDSEAPPEQISETLAIELNKAEKAATTGGSIIEVKNVINKLLDSSTSLRKDGFIENIINSTDVIIRSSTGWKEISDEEKKHDVASNYLSNLDLAGYMWAQQATRRSQCNIEKIFNTESVSLISRTVDTPVDDSICFPFGNPGSICYPGSVLEEMCNVLVATTVKSKEENLGDSYIFPTVQEFNSRGLLGQSLIGLTINNNVRSSNFSGADVSITFKHDDLYKESDGCLLVPGSPACIFWDTYTSSWSSEGCEVISSSPEETVCSCNHLTNFGIVLDWEGKAPANDPALDAISTFLLVCSCMAVMMTEILLILQRKDTRSALRKVAERNRNFSLFFAQLFFIALVGQFRTISCAACEVFGALTHFLWLNFFCWTVIEGYFFYTALVTIFETKEFRLWKYFLVGYGIPCVIVLITVIISVSTDSFLYLRRDSEGRVNSCWLHSYGILSILLPVGLVVIVNSVITGIAVSVTYKKGRKSRNAVLKDKIILALKNTLLVSFLLGLTWIVGFLPYSRAQQYVTVILNASMGFYILFYSVLANQQVRGDLKGRVTELWSNSRLRDLTKETITKESDSELLSTEGPGKLKNGSPSTSNTIYSTRL